MSIVPKQQVQHPQAADVAVVGSGLAGIAAALAANEKGVRVVMLTRGEIGCGNSELASGGLAAVTGIDPEDTPQHHLADMERAARGLMFDDVAETFVTEAGTAIRWLERLGVQFARGDDDLRLFKAPGHSRARSIRCEGGGTRKLMKPLIAELLRRGISVVSGVAVIDIERDGAGAVSAVHFVDGERRTRRLAAGAVVLACGGLGQLFPLTSNSPHATGGGYYLALRAGAVLTDMEFVQFTPTSLAFPPEVRGISTGGGLLAQEGVRLLNAAGERFMPRYDERAEAATRDIVARAIYREVAEGRGTDHGGVFVEMKNSDPAAVAQVSGRFLRAMARVGMDPYSTLVEVAPDVHFLMGGVAIDRDGWTGVPGLYSGGEITAGLHGATRLNSNGLTEAVVFGRRAGTAAADRKPKTAWSGLPSSGRGEIATYVADDPRRSSPEPANVPSVTMPTRAKTAEKSATRNAGRPNDLRTELRLLLSGGAGIERDAVRTRAARERHSGMAVSVSDTATGLACPAEQFDLEAAYVMSGLILAAAELRTESRGAHFRADHTAEDDLWRKHICFALPR